MLNDVVACLRPLDGEIELGAVVDDGVRCSVDFDVLPRHQAVRRSVARQHVVDANRRRQRRRGLRRHRLRAGVRDHDSVEKKLAPFSCHDLFEGQLPQLVFVDHTEAPGLLHDILDTRGPPVCVVDAGRNLFALAADRRCESVIEADRADVDIRHERRRHELVDLDQGRTVVGCAIRVGRLYDKYTQEGCDQPESGDMLSHKVLQVWMSETRTTNFVVGY